MLVEVHSLLLRVLSLFDLALQEMSVLPVDVLNLAVKIILLFLIVLPIEGPHLCLLVIEFLLHSLSTFLFVDLLFQLPPHSLLIFLHLLKR